MEKQKCEKCNMEGNFLKVYDDGSAHFFCHHHAPEGSSKLEAVKRESKFKKFLPLIIIFVLIIVFTVVTTVLHGFQLDFAMRMMMGAFFSIFGFLKVINLKAFADAYSTYDLLAKRSRAYAFTYPFFEILLAVLYLGDFGGIYRDIFTFILMAFSAIGVMIKLRQKEEIPCACLGMVFKLPMTYVTLVEDVIMAVEALIMVLLATV